MFLNNKAQLGLGCQNSTRLGEECLCKNREQARVGCCGPTSKKTVSMWNRKHEWDECSFYSKGKNSMESQNLSRIRRAFRQRGTDPLEVLESGRNEEDTQANEQPNLGN